MEVLQIRESMMIPFHGNYSKVPIELTVVSDACVLAFHYVVVQYLSRVMDINRLRVTVIVRTRLLHKGSITTAKLHW